MREEAGLGCTKQHTKKVEGVLVAEPGSVCDGRDERHGARQDPPAQHNPAIICGHRSVRAAGLDGTSKMKICNEEDAGAETECRLRQTEVLVHREGAAETHVSRGPDTPTESAER